MIDKWFPLYMLMLFIVSVALGEFFYLKTEDETWATNTLGWLPLVSLMVFILAFSIGYGPIPWLMMGESTLSNYSFDASFPLEATPQRTASTSSYLYTPLLVQSLSLYLHLLSFHRRAHKRGLSRSISFVTFYKPQGLRW